MRLARESVQAEQHMEAGAASIDELTDLLADANDEKTFAAMGIAKTIFTVRIPTLFSSGLSTSCW
jgi:hypothetical protein